jgi:hypothetical protein
VTPVPALWLADDGAIEDYIRLLWCLSSSSSKDKMFTDKSFLKATTEARELFGSKEFQHVLDGALAEDYLARSQQIENELRLKGNSAP